MRYSRPRDGLDKSSANSPNSVARSGLSMGSEGANFPPWPTATVVTVVIFTSRSLTPKTRDEDQSFQISAKSTSDMS